MGAVPTVIAIGSFVASGGAIDVQPPSIYSVGDILLLFVCSANQEITTPSGWSEVANSPQYTGVAGAAGGVRLAVYWKWSTASENSVNIPDTGSITVGRMMCVGGIDPTTPIEVTAGSTLDTAGTALTAPGVNTSIGNALVILGVGMDADVDGTDILTGATNGNLASLSKQGDDADRTGVGAGLAIYSAIKVVPGDTGTTAITSSISQTAAFVTIALVPTSVFSDGCTESIGSSTSSLGGGVADDWVDESVSSPDETISSDSPVVYLGHAFINYSTQNGAVAVNVPEDTTFAVLFYAGCTNSYYDEAFNQYNFFPVLGGESLTFALRNQQYLSALCGDIALFYLQNPQRGMQVYSWRSSLSIDYGYMHTLVFFKGVDQDDPFVSTGTATNQSTSGTLTVSSLSTVAGSRIVGAGVGSYATMSMDTNGQTPLFSLSDVAAHGGTYRMQAAVAPRQDSFSTLSAMYTGIIAAVLRPGSDPEPPDPQLASISESSTAGDHYIGPATTPEFLSAYSWEAYSTTSSGIEEGVTVPPEATLALLFVFSGDADPALSATSFIADLDGDDFDFVLVQAWSTDPASQLGMYSLNNPNDGSVDINWEAVTVEGNKTFTVAFFKDTAEQPFYDTSSRIINDTVVDTAFSTFPNYLTVGTMGARPGVINDLSSDGQEVNSSITSASATLKVASKVSADSFTFVTDADKYNPSITLSLRSPEHVWGITKYGSAIESFAFIDSSSSNCILNGNLIDTFSVYGYSDSSYVISGHSSETFLCYDLFSLNIGTQSTTVELNAIVDFVIGEIEYAYIVPKIIAKILGSIIVATRGCSEFEAVNYSPWSVNIDRYDGGYAARLYLSSYYAKQSVLGSSIVSIYGGADVEAIQSEQKIIANIHPAGCYSMKLEDYEYITTHQD